MRLSTGMTIVERARLLERKRKNIATGITSFDSEDIADLDLANYSAEIYTMAGIAKGAFANEDKKAVRKYLCFGMAGTGKTSLVRQSAWILKDQYGIHPSYLEIKCSTLINRIRSMVTMRDEISKATAYVEEHFPIIVVFDELDALGYRERVGGIEEQFALLVCDLIDNRFYVDSRIEGKLVFVGITNNPELVDEAMRSRLGSPLYVPLPTLEVACEILSKMNIPRAQEVGKAIFANVAPNRTFPRALIEGCITMIEERRKILAGKDPTEIALGIHANSPSPHPRSEVQLYEQNHDSYIKQSDLTKTFFGRKL